MLAVVSVVAVSFSCNSSSIKGWFGAVCRGPRYFEVDIDVGSSKSAASVVGLVQGALKGLVIDMAITLEGHTKVSCQSTYETLQGVCRSLCS